MIHSSSGPEGALMERIDCLGERARSVTDMGGGAPTVFTCAGIGVIPFGELSLQDQDAAARPITTNANAPYLNQCF